MMSSENKNVSLKVIDIADGYSIWCEVYDVGDSKELSVFLKDTDDFMSQDICCVRPHRNERTGEVDNRSIDCIVWGDSGDEDYTDKTEIDIYKEG